MREIAKAVKGYYLSKHGATKLEGTLRSYEQNYEGDRATAEEEFIADCIAGMFSTDEGVNDFISWLKKDSGYSAKEKKTILQKLADWVLEIIDAVQELLQGGSLNDVVAEFAKEETARFKEIRQMFLEALDEVAEGTVGRETKNTAESGVRFSYKTSNKSLTSKGKKKYNKNSAYDEFTSNGMQWAYGADTKIGDIGYVFNSLKESTALSRQRKQVKVLS